jgi:hypothetical protein
MQNLNFQQIVQKFKKERNESLNSNILYNVDMSTEYIIPNSLLFKEPDEVSNEELVDIDPEYKYNKIDTHEKFYAGGIMEHLYNIKHTSYKWLFGLCFINQYHSIFNGQINGFFLGMNSDDFIRGMKFNNQLKCDINWLGMSCNNIESENFINGISSNDITNLNNILHVKYMIERQFNRLNLICNFNNTENKEKILFSVITLSTLLTNKGVVLTRINEPCNWSDKIVDYIILLGMLFEKVEVCRYPIQKKKKIIYRYYLICKNKKSNSYNSLIYRKLISYFKCNVHIKFINQIYESPIIKEYMVNILQVKELLINNLTHPCDELNDIISKIKPLINN